MMLERKISQCFEQWSGKKNKKALLVTGAGQVGKTFSIRQFARQHYEDVVEINFLKEPSAKTIFKKNTTAYAVINALDSYAGRSLKRGKTLIFLDEIQECPEAREMMRNLLRDGRYDYIEAGMVSGASGYEEAYRMYPLDLEEFLSANGIKGETIEYLRDCFQQKWSVSGSVHGMMERFLGNYVMVGGMPAAVQAFLDTHDMKKVAEVQSDILAQYRQRVEKYSMHDKKKLTKILELIPVQLNDENKRFMLADIAKSARMERYEQCFDILSELGMAMLCYHVNEPKAPLKEQEKRNLFKLFLADTGLLCTLAGEDVSKSVAEKKWDVNRGSILENMAAQIFTANGLSFWYFSRKNKGELDFLIEKDKKAIPIELRTEATRKNHPALNFALGETDWQMTEGLVFYDGNVKREGKVTYLPFYMLMFL